MKTVLVLFDSLNRHMLGCYGGTRVPTPNFDRLAARSVRYDNHYVGSLPCMPARRDLLTGRLSFLHRSWGPLEPFDDAFPEILAKQAGTYSHLVTDHFHYWEDGGATYHTRYDSHEFIRGQEGDPWKAMVQPQWERLREMYSAKQFASARRTYKAQNIINREFIREEQDFPSVKCVRRRARLPQAQWQRGKTGSCRSRLSTRTSPSTPPHASASPFPTDYRGPVLDWPRYGRVDELPEECEELRANYYAVLALCDHLMGQVLDAFDAQDLWKDTALIVTTDHGFLLGEHDFWAKNRMNVYQEVAHIPLLVHDPRHPAAPGESCAALTQTMDLAPSLLELFGVAPTPAMEGIPFSAARAGTRPREAILYGYFGGAVNVTDGRHTYHRYPADLRHQEIYQYTVMPTHISMPFTPEELSDMRLAGPLPFTKGAKVMQVPVLERSPFHDKYGPGGLLEDETRLYDLASDPGQATAAAGQGGGTAHGRADDAADGGQPRAARGLRAARPGALMLPPKGLLATPRGFASLRRMVLADGPEAGLDCIALSTGGGLDAWLLAGRSLDIGPLWVARAAARLDAAAGLPAPVPAPRGGGRRARLRPAVRRYPGHLRPRPYPPTRRRPAAAWPPALHPRPRHALPRARRAAGSGSRGGRGAPRRPRADPAPTDRGGCRRQRAAAARRGGERRPHTGGARHSSTTSISAGRWSPQASPRRSTARRCRSPTGPATPPRRPASPACPRWRASPSWPRRRGWR